MTTATAISLALAGPVKDAITSDARFRQLPLLNSPEARRMHGALLLRWLSNTPFSFFAEEQGKHVVDWISQLAMYLNRSSTANKSYEVVVPPYNLAYLVENRGRTLTDDLLLGRSGLLREVTLPLLKHGDCQPRMFKSFGGAGGYSTSQWARFRGLKS